MQRIRYNSCGHRGCPICAYVKIARWLQQQRQQLLACDHDHVIFTMPSALNPLWIANVPQMTTLLFQALRATLMELCGDPAYGGFVPGILAVLQTWGQTLVLHPHLHCLVTGGGLTPEGTWKSGRNGYLLPVRVVMALFRGKFLAVLRQGVRQGRLTLPPGWREQQILNLLNKLGRPKWNVHLRQRGPRPEQVVDYVGQYIRGLSNGSRRGGDRIGIGQFVIHRERLRGLLLLRLRLFLVLKLLKKMRQTGAIFMRNMIFLAKIQIIAQPFGIRRLRVGGNGLVS